MNWLIDIVVVFLNEQKEVSPLSQVSAFFGAVTLFMGLFVGWPVLAMTRKVRASVTRYEDLQQQLATARKEAAQIEAERQKLLLHTPDGFLAEHAREIREGNEEKAMKLAESFVDRQQEALFLAFRARMEKAVLHSVEDGAAAFAQAQHWGQAALALKPSNRDMRMMIDELAEAEAFAAKGARVTLKGGEARKSRAETEDQLPTDLEALRTAFFNARVNGHYRVMLHFAEHGLMLTRRRPFGPGSKMHLLFRQHRAEALFTIGRRQEALAEAEPLAAEFIALFGERDPETLYTRHLIALSRSGIGDAAGALAELEGSGGLLQLQREVLGAEHSGVFTTRYLIAGCRSDMGDAAGALAELVGDDGSSGLLQLETEVLGARHPDVLRTRHTIARCRKDLGDGGRALAELEALLPLQTEVLGAEHPYVRATRGLIAEWRKVMGAF